MYWVLLYFVNLFWLKLRRDVSWSLVHVWIVYVCVRQIRNTAGLLYGGMNAVCAVRPSSPPRVSSAAAFSRLPLSNTKSTAGTLSSPLSFLPVDGLLVLLQILKNTHTPTYTSLKRPHHTLNSLLLLTEPLVVLLYSASAFFTHSS